MTPALSIIIPAYNVAAYVGDAVRSALDQSLRAIEVIVVDDGSTDATPDILARFSDPRLRVIRQANGGLSAARNTGIGAARAGLIGFLDGDDLWHPDKARRHLDLLARHPAVGLTFCHSRYIDEAGAATGRVLVTGPSRPGVQQMVLRNAVANGSTPIVRAACFREAGLFDTALTSCEDWEMWVRILRDTSHEAMLVPEVLTDYRINTQSLSFNFDAFLRNAEAAAAKMTAQSPGIAPARIARGLAMCYRIAGSKALKIGQTRLALRLIARALRLSPALIVTDPRVAGTLATIVAPKRMVELGHRLLQRRAGIKARDPRRSSEAS